MNERIRELAKQFAIDFLNKSGYDMREYEPFLEETEKFAELIVRECAEVVDNDDSSYPYDSFGHKLKQHFGVEDNEEDETCPRCGDTWSGTSCGLPDCGWVTGVDSTN